MSHFHNGSFDKEKERERNRHLEEERRARDERFLKEKERKTKKKNKIIAGTVVVLLMLTSLFVNSLFSPGVYDGFAKCLTEKGAKMYGEDWCPNTQGQKNMFGKSFRYIDYYVDPNLNIRPTWMINGKKYERVQSFETLAALTGCEY